MSTDEREGGDITAADMVIPPTEPSKIQEYFAGATVFITGVTGFLGRLVLEKLLRSCPDLRRCYVLIRPKNGKSVEKRFEEMFDNVVFDTLKRENIKAFSKVRLLCGDLEEPNLGLLEESQKILKSEVNCVFHLAATLKFNEKLTIATQVNVRATRDLLMMAREFLNLKSFVYTSTAFSHCPRKEIDEEFYEPPVTGERLLTIVESLDDEALAAIESTLLGKWPNTYEFTKAVAEDVVRKEAKGLPVAVVRPSAVIATWKEPIAGFLDNMYGPTGVIVGAAIGVVRTMHCDPDLLSDLVPADYVVNIIISVSWDIAEKRSLNQNNEINGNEAESDAEEEVPIYNYVTSPDNPLTWRRWKKLAEKHIPTVPTTLQVWHYMLFLNANKYMHLLCLIFLQRIPAYIVDFLAYCVGKKPLMVEEYKKIEKSMNVLSYFTTKQWIFRNKNVKRLWQKMNYEDRVAFPFNMSKFDWEDYFYTYVRGGRAYLLKDPLDTIPQGRMKYIKLQIAHYVLVTTLCLLLLKLSLFGWNLILRMF